MANKLLCQQLKNIIRSLKDHELEETLKVYEQISKVRLEKVCRMISYKCYECSIVYKGKKANGYGRNEQEATANCTKNVFEFLLEEESNISLIMQALKKDLANGAGASLTNPMSEATGNKIPRPESGNHQRFPSRNDKVNSSLALNLSAVHQNGDTSFDMKGDIDTLSKNIGNISMINNSKIIDNPNASQLEMDDLILKMMLENPEKAKNFKEMTLQSNPMGLGLKKQHSQSIEDNRMPEQKKVLNDNTNYQSLHQRRNSYSKTQPIHELTETSINSSFNKENNHGYDNRTQQVLRSSTALNRSGSFEPGLQNTYQQGDLKHKQKCVCGAEEELAKAKAKIEYLEKQIKVLTEENKKLKNQSLEVKEKENHFKSTDVVSSVSNVSTQLTTHYKSMYEKIDNQPDVFSHQASVSENNEKQPGSSTNIASYKVNVPPLDLAEKQRSQSVDIHSKKKASSLNDISGEQSTKVDIKKLIPRLRLDMLPNYHLKNQKPITNPVGSLNLSVSQTTNQGYSSLIQHSQQQQVSDSYQNYGGSAYLTHSSVSSSLSGSQKFLNKK